MHYWAIPQYYYVMKFLLQLMFSQFKCLKRFVNLQKENTEMCIVICEHQARELLSIVDRALILSECKIIAEGSPSSLLK